jgi:hypothetical protein
MHCICGMKKNSVVYEVSNFTLFSNVGIYFTVYGFHYEYVEECCQHTFLAISMPIIMVFLERNGNMPLFIALLL